MGKAAEAIEAFIESIPDAKLVEFKDPNPSYTIYSNTNFRLDAQNVENPHRTVRIHVQINRHSLISALGRMRKKTRNTGTTVAKALIPTNGSWSAATIRAALQEGRMI